MKITYLLTWPYEMGGTERTVITQASGMAACHDVEIVGVLSSRSDPFFKIPGSVAHRALVRTDADGHVLAAEAVDARAGRLDDLHAAPSRLVPTTWEPAFSQLTDLSLSHWFAGLQSDVLVTTTPALLALGAQLAPERVVVVHQEHRTSERRGSSLPPLMHYGPRVDAVAFLTAPTAEHFRQAWGAAAPTVLQVLNPLASELRPRSGLARPLIVAAGRLTAEKRFDHLIEAFAPVAAVFPEWRLRIFGDGPQEPLLRRQITRLRLNDHVELMGPTSNMAMEWASASIAALSSRTEGLSLVIQEAMAAGLPVVSYACPNGPAELITHAVDGVLVENGNVAELTKALTALVSDESRRESLSIAARRRAQDFDPVGVSRQWDANFAALVAEVRPGEGRLQRVIRRSQVSRAVPEAPRDVETVVSVDSPLAPEGGGTSDQLPIRPASPEPIVIVAGSETALNRGRLPQGASAENLELLVRALEEASVPFFRLPGAGTRCTFVVRESDRAAVADSLVKAAERGAVYVSPVAVNGRAGRAAPADDALDVWRMESSRVRVHRQWVDERRTLFYRGDLGSDVVFWREESDRLVGDAHGIVTEVPVSWLADCIRAERDGIHVPELRQLAGIKLVDEIDFPIDAVYTWVDGSDPSWLTSRRTRRATAGASLHLEADSEARYRSRDELRYSLRSLEYYAPWIRNIYLVTAGQSPSWLAEEHPGLVVVDHSEIFSRAADLPTFNSHAIESQLHHIEGLAEQFLYINDDVFFGRPVPPNLFFTPGGIPAAFRSPTLIGFPAGEAPPHVRAALNNRELIRRDFGRTLTNGLLHVAHPLQRSVMYELEERYATDFERTSGHPFRHDDDISVTSSLFQHYGLLTGKVVLGATKAAYVGLGGNDVGPRLSRLVTDRAYDMFSIGDYHQGEIAPEEVDDMVRSFLGSYWPFPGRFER